MYSHETYLDTDFTMILSAEVKIVLTGILVYHVLHSTLDKKSMISVGTFSKL